jgi:hypothetical protein
MFHPEVADQVSFLIVDNHPEGPAAADLKALEGWVPLLRYVPFRGFRGTSIRDLIFREANADIVCCVDSHVLVQPGGLAAVISWFDEHPDSRDLIQGPLLSDGLDQLIGTHFEPTWGAGMYGQWGVDPRVHDQPGKPFEIGMQGLGLFACRREAWPGINPRFRGFGGEEGYVHEKVRRAGGRVLCHPAVGWAHRFPRPLGPPYKPSWEDSVRNYRIGWKELGWSTDPIDAHFRDHFDTTGVAASLEHVLEEAAREADNPFTFFDGIFCLNLDRASERWREATRRHHELGIAWHVERFPAIETPDSHHRGNALSFRAMLVEAGRRGYEHVLVLEDDAVFLDDTLDVMSAVTEELADVPWDLCYLGGCVWGQDFPFLESSTVLKECGPVTCTHAVAVHRRAYERILADMPTDSDGLDRWLEEWLAIDQYLSRRIADGTYRAVITAPRVASQPNLLMYDDADRALAARYGL